MASKSYPRSGYNGGAVTELEHERLVNALAPDGLIGNPTDAPMVYADGAGTRQVRIRANRFALVRGSLYESGDNDITLGSLAANSSGATRIDLVVLRLSRTDYSVTETVITGTPGAGAPSPVQQTGSTGFWDLPLAEVTVQSGVVNLPGSAVKPRAWFVGEDGNILCTSTTRPPHQAGRIIRELDTNRTLQSTGAGGTWIVLAEDTGWVTFPASSGWTAQGFFVRRKNGWVTVEISGFRSGGNIGSSTATQIGTLPAGFRPSHNTVFVALLSSPDHTTNAYISPAGAVILQPNFSHGISTSSWVFAAVAFPLDET